MCVCVSGDVFESMTRDDIVRESVTFEKRRKRDNGKEIEKRVLENQASRRRRQKRTRRVPNENGSFSLCGVL